MKAYLEKFIICYLKQRDLENILSFFTEHVISVGTGEHEVAQGKAELRRLMATELEQLPDPMRYEITNYFEMPVTEQVKSTFANVRIIMEQEGKCMTMDTRLTLVWVFVGNDWKISQAHMSMSSQGQEEENFFPFHYGKRAKGILTVDTSSKLMELLTEALPGGIVGAYLEEGYPLYVINDKMLGILGYTYEELIKATDEKMLNIVYEEDREFVKNAIAEQFEKNGEYELIYRMMGKNGRLFWVNDIGKKITTATGREAMLSVIMDITERIQREEQLKFAAERDTLTELYNRKKAISLIEECFERGEGGSLFIGDVDNFKHINDTKGHFIGDEVLRKLAQIMKAYTGEYCLACRLGGDEYAMFFYQEIGMGAAMETIKKIQAEFLCYAQETVPELKVSFSVGGAARTEKEILTALYCRADDALYLAKQNKGTLVIL